MAGACAGTSSESTAPATAAKEAGTAARRGLDRRPRSRADLPGKRRGRRHARAEVLGRREVGGHRHGHRRLRHRVGAGAQGRAARAARHDRDRGRHRGAQGGRGAGARRRGARAARVRARAAAASSTASSRRRPSTTRRRRSRRPRRRPPRRRRRSRTAEARLAKSLLAAPMDGVVALRARQRRRPRREHGRQRAAVPHRRQPAARPDGVGAVVAPRRPCKVGQPLEFTTDALPGRTFTGKVMFINPAIDEASRSAKVVAEVPNPDGALKGGVVREGAHRRGEPARRAAGAARGAAQLERRAADRRGVRRRAATRPRSAPVKTGAGERRDASRCVSGLQAGDQVVTRGGFALRPGDRVAVAKGEGA